MRRWNGWGDDRVNFQLPATANRFLSAKVGVAVPLKSCHINEALSKVPASRLPKHPLISREKNVRLMHARGQSLPDWLAIHSGQMSPIPDGVAFPKSHEDVQSLLDWAVGRRCLVIPCGGGTSVVGHLTPLDLDRPILTISMSRMDSLLTLDKESQLATLGAGATGPKIESQLKKHGFVLGHYPQSFEYSTLGGWVATRSSGQQSLRYGRIEQLFAGAKLATPSGTVAIPCFPASAAGPDLREVVLGSEGRLGILTEVTVRVQRKPKRDQFYVAFFSCWQNAVSCVRELVQRRVGVSMLRLGNPLETDTMLSLFSYQPMVSLLEKYLYLRGARKERCILTFGVTGDSSECAFVFKQVALEIKKQRGFLANPFLGKQWQKGRYRYPYLRNSAWEKGYVVDTLETAVNWSRVTKTMMAIEDALRNGLNTIGEKVHAFSHLSHLYPQGSSIYTTFVFRVGASYEETLERWQSLNNIASRIIQEHHGTISHQHGVGIEHASYFAREKGAAGMQAISEVFKIFDPEDVLNNGNLTMSASRMKHERVSVSISEKSLYANPVSAQVYSASP